MDDQGETNIETWVKSMVTMLGCVDNPYAQACSIPLVAEQLGKFKAESYTPKVVSVGPLHRKNTSLLYMEEIKWRCITYLLHRSIEEEEEEDTNETEEENEEDDDQQEEEEEGENFEVIEANSLRKCGKAILKFEEIFRACYNVGDLKFNSNDFVKIMVLDGCFLLELLICGSEELRNRIKCKEEEKNPSPGVEVGKREHVLSDLTMVENQIPFLVLHTLFGILFPNVFEEQVDVESTIKKLILSLLGYIDSSSIALPFKQDKKKKEAASSNHQKDDLQEEDEELYGFHFLELVHSFIDKQAEEESKLDNAENDVAIEVVNNNGTDEQIDVTVQGKKKVSSNEQDKKREIELKRCATMLEAAGVQIMIPPTEAESSEPWEMTNQVMDFENQLHFLVHKLKWLLGKIMNNKRRSKHRDLAPAEIKFDLRIRFKNSRTLEIPPLHITETTEAKWRNFIAWELNRSDQEKLINPKGETKINCRFISYAFFFQNLICCVHDVQLLRDRNVILVHDDEAVERNNEGKMKKVMSNEELLNLFRKVTEGIPDDKDYLDSNFRNLFEDLNSHTSTTTHPPSEIGKFAWHYLRRFVTWIWSLCTIAYRVLRRDYIPTGWTLVAVLAATAGLALTAVQTAYSVISVKKQ